MKTNKLLTLVTAGAYLSGFFGKGIFAYLPSYHPVQAEYAFQGDRTAPGSIEQL